MRFLPVSVIALLILALYVSGAGASKVPEPCTPQIEAVVPSIVFLGERVIIHGTCLAGSPADKDVKLSLGEAPVSIISVSETEIAADVNSYDVADTVTLTRATGKAAAQLEVRNWIEPPADTFRAGVIEVRMKTGADIDAISTQLGGQDREDIFEGWDIPELEGWWRLQVEGDTIARVREWAGHPGVEWAQPGIISSMHLASPPNDSCYPDPTPPACDVSIRDILALLHGDDGQWGVQRISAEGAWPIETGDPSVRIAVMDTGVEIGSGELYAEIGSRVVLSRDYTGTGIGPATSHATWVAGVAAARTDNSLGVAGVAPDVSVASYKIFEAGPIVEGWWNAVIIAVIQDSVDVINMSFEGISQAPDQIEQAVMDYASNAGVVLVAAAGNSNADMDEPGVFVCRLRNTTTS